MAWGRARGQALLSGGGGGGGRRAVRVGRGQRRDQRAAQLAKARGGAHGVGLVPPHARCVRRVRRGVRGRLRSGQAAVRQAGPRAAGTLVWPGSQARLQPAPLRICEACGSQGGVLVLGSEAADRPRV
jgi:hypothetical protein